jgi:hypothetical protein
MADMEIASSGALRQYNLRTRREDSKLVAPFMLFVTYISLSLSVCVFSPILRTPANDHCFRQLYILRPSLISLLKSLQRLEL